MKREVPIVGMHCKSCEKMIKDELMEIKGVTSATVSLGKKLPMSEQTIVYLTMKLNKLLSALATRLAAKVGRSLPAMVIHGKPFCGVV